MGVLTPNIASTPDWASQLTAWSTLAAATLAGFALLGAIYTIRRSRVSERETRAHSYIARYNDVDQIPSVVRMNTFMTLRNTTEAARIAEWEAMSYEDKLRTVHYMNFWEELAGMYNRDLVDRALVRDYFGGAALALWDRSRWFTVYQRDRSNARIMLELQQMCADIKRKREEEARPTSGPLPDDRWPIAEHIWRYRKRREERRRAADEAIT